jgi:hypothetical protein
MFSADFEGSLSKPLIFKASCAPDTDYQQSYPQKDWICPDPPPNQALTTIFNT